MDNLTITISPSPLSYPYAESLGFPKDYSKRDINACVSISLSLGFM